MKKAIIFGFLMLFAFAFAVNANNASVVTNLAIGPDPAYRNNNIYCSFKVTDADAGQPLSVNYTFFRNGTAYRQGTSTVTNNVVKQIFLGSSIVRKNEQWKCEIIPYDGIDYGASEESNTIIIQNTIPTITSSPGRNASINVLYKYTILATDTDADHLTYELITAPDGMNITSNVVQWKPTVEGTFDVNIRVSDGEGERLQNYTITVRTAEMLDIYRVDAKVDNRSSERVTDGDTVDIYPGSKVDFAIQVENLFSTSEKIDINNVFINAKILGIDDGDDLEEETNEFDLRYNTKVTKTLSFSIPNNVDEDSYTVEIHVEGEDDNHQIQTADMTFTADLIKKNHDLAIESVDISPLTIQCDRTLSVDYTIRNKGRSYEDNVASVFECTQLNIAKRDTFPLSENYGDSDNSRRVSNTFEIDNTQKAGAYSCTLKVFYDGTNLFTYQTYTVNVKDCGASTPTPTPTQPIVQPTVTPPVQPPVVTQPTEVPFTETTTYLILLVAANVLLVGMILIFLARAIVGRK